MRILIAEDEKDLAEALSVFFERNHFTVDTVYNGADAYDYAASGNYDAVILDVMMPKINGIQVLQKIRKSGLSVPVMMLTAKAEKNDRILGFDSGADDYLPKPFETDELLARVRAMLRRRDSSYQPPLLTFADLTLDSQSGELICRNKRLKLMGKEFQIMELFMRDPKVIFSSERIMERVWGWDCNAEIHVVWVNISNIRKKLTSLNSRTAIRVSRGLGYSLEDTDGS